MNSSDTGKKVFDAKEMARLYNEKPGMWLLLEVLESDKRGKAKKLRLMAFAEAKEELYDFLLENEDWNWDKNYIFVFSNPGRPCDLF